MKKLLILFTFLTTFLTYSQKEANIWYFGENAGLDFNTTPPTALTNGALSTLEGCSSFSDANGKLLFYSDGITVWDKNHAIMKYSNGNLANDLKGNPSSSQSGMIIPKPNSTSIYYLFTVDDGPDFDFNTGSITEPGKGFNVYTIDMSLNAGNGEVIGPEEIFQMGISTILPKRLQLLEEVNVIPIGLFQQLTISFTPTKLIKTVLEQHLLYPI